MANLKELRNRIASIKSTRKITSAMKMVAAAKLRQAQEALSESGYFAASLARIITRLAKTIDYCRETDIANGKPPRYEMPRLMVGTENAKKYLIIVFSSSRGLCGGFNINVVKKAMQLIRHLEKEKKEIRLICVGTKAYEMLKHSYGDRIVFRTDASSNPKEQRRNAERISMRVLDMYEDGEIDACAVLYNQFHSAISQEVRIDSLLPLKPLSVLQPFTDETPWGFDDSPEHTYKIDRPSKQAGRGRSQGGFGTNRTNKKGNAQVRAAAVKGRYRTTQVNYVLNSEAEETLHVKDPLEYDFEPANPEILLKAMLPELMTTLIYRSTLDSAASENGARMTAMDNATDNAGDIIDDLTLLYNRRRQSQITSELTEIISGAEAL